MTDDMDKDECILPMDKVLMSEGDLLEGVTYLRGFFKELREELLSFSRDDIEVSRVLEGSSGWITLSLDGSSSPPQCFQTLHCCCYLWWWSTGSG